MATLIPEVLHEAAQIFLEELNAHLKFFKEILSDLNDPDRQSAFGPTQARMLAEKFHLVKGASGFLKLDALKDTSGDAEKYFRDKWTSGTDRIETRVQLLKANRVIEEHRDLLQEELSKPQLSKPQG